MKYCRFCGSRKLKDASYETRTEAGVGLGLKHGGIHRESEGRAQFPTVFCETCREIDAACSHRPLEAYYSLGGFDLTLYIPHQLAVMLATLRVGETDLRSFIQHVAERGYRRLPKFLKKGRNPCHWRHMGYPLRVKMRGQSIKVFLILGAEDTESKSISMRLAYGGGMAQCP